MELLLHISKLSLTTGKRTDEVVVFEYLINFFPNLYRLTYPETPVPPEVVRVLVAEVLVAAAAPLPLTHPVPPGDRATLPGVNPISHWAPTATTDLKALVFPALAIAATAILC